MQYIIPPTDIRKYSQNGYVEFGFMFSEEDVAILEQDLLHISNENKSLFHKNESLKQLTHSKHIIKIASELSQRNPLKYIFSRIYTGKEICEVFANEETTLESLTSFQHTLLAFVVCIRGDQQKSPFLPSTAGHVTCINTKCPFSLKENDIEKNSLYVLTVFGEKNTRYFYNSKDRFSYEGALDGFSNGDSLSSKDYPLHYTQ